MGSLRSWQVLDNSLPKQTSQSGMSRAEQQAERSRILADEEVNRIRGQLVSLGSRHHADDSAQLHSSSPKHAAHHPGIDRHGSLQMQGYKCYYADLIGLGKDYSKPRVVKYMSHV